MPRKHVFSFQNGIQNHIKIAFHGFMLFGIVAILIRLGLTEQRFSKTFGVKFIFNPSNLYISRCVTGFSKVSMKLGYPFFINDIKDIDKCQKSKYTPTLQKWGKEMYHYLNMGKITAAEKNKLTQFEIKWREALLALSI